MVHKTKHDVSTSACQHFNSCRFIRKLDFCTARYWIVSMQDYGMHNLFFMETKLAVFYMSHACSWIPFSILSLMNTQSHIQRSECLTYTFQHVTFTRPNVIILMIWSCLATYKYHQYMHGTVCIRTKGALWKFNKHYSLDITSWG